MSPRIKVLRKVSSPPIIKGFKPYGENPDRLGQETVQLLYEEYESLRLCDYERLNHHQASVLMGVSRPTFTRIYASALQKIATAFVEGRQISIAGGKVYFDSDWYHCSQCGCYFNNPEKNQKVENCPLCGSLEINNYEYDDAQWGGGTENENDMCVCPSCGFERNHQPGKPCHRAICPRCNSLMRRKGVTHSTQLKD